MTSAHLEIGKLLALAAELAERHRGELAATKLAWYLLLWRGGGRHVAMALEAFGPVDAGNQARLRDIDRELRKDDELMIFKLGEAPPEDLRARPLREVDEVARALLLIWPRHRFYGFNL